MPIYAVTYLYTDDTEAKDRIRPEHRAFLASLLDEGVLLASGPYVDADGGALLILQGEGTAEEVLSRLDADPFRREGLIAERSIRPWDVVIGGFAS
ncbi:YciI family protein [Brachybacterium hainanense]|uniref:YciI family protein n=1 Tax=Brachybacterium hainanense TaxID=1541174 RepID=A0ABV6RBR2_9MICO